ncbi:3-keto-5-aminohexanoate cleavage enzyme [Variibacter gotjawalensis]|uniref:3-keto-5-aminohexanoate cleavage enzyme n=1 Tax=Variibacter gotjawalensis TaxID=1333996 RepID=A0A0S3PXJ0_9BRAD|nr:3-keto-5-aminohexanoate cleavage protein [Variibacter gotjawalensis]NIK46501.1 uncharacterized protein (DUF849 family) [Variibacter gotjawalensis]RZS48409.1 uncharacterized protein (DUF849 family) [Variibacter gotjawalensis]BAT60668.1 3-keto-5-aminohexanoate cleavage enzyme [Variibacter gotjawalensis]
MIIQACLNGGRMKDFNAAVPTTPDEIIADAAAAVKAGANELHIHIRDADGRETLKPDVVDATIAGVRKVCPGTLVGISTGHWIEKDDFRRRDYLQSIQVLPDYASVNMNEGDCEGVVRILRDRNVPIEVGMWVAADAKRAMEIGVESGALRYLIEIMSQEQANADEDLAGFDAILPTMEAKPVLLHGLNVTKWPLADLALSRGYSTRVGFEDGKLLPDGREAKSNAEIVAEAIRRKSGPKV